MIHTYNGIFFSLKNEGNSGMHYNMGKFWGHYAKWNKPVTKGYSLSNANNIRFLEQIHRPQSTRVAARGLEKENGELLFNGSWVTVLQDEKNSKDEWWWWLHKSVNVFCAIELYT